MAEFEEAAEVRAATLRENASELRTKLDDATCSSGEKKAATTLAAKAEKQAEELAPRDDDDNDDSAKTQLSLHRVPVTTAGKPRDTAQRNFTDAESRIMIRKGAFMQAFNAQAAVSKDQFVVAHGVTNDGTDAQHLGPMLERVRENCGAMPKILSADTGHFSDANITRCAQSAHRCVHQRRQERGRQTLQRAPQ